MKSRVLHSMTSASLVEPALPRERIPARAARSRRYSMGIGRPECGMCVDQSDTVRVCAISRARVWGRRRCSERRCPSVNIHTVSFRSRLAARSSEFLFSAFCSKYALPPPRSFENALFLTPPAPPPTLELLKNCFRRCAPDNDCLLVPESSAE